MWYETISQWLVDGVTAFEWWGILIYTLVTVHITIVSVTLYLHRHSAHQSLALHPVVAHFFRFWLWLATGMETRAWTAVHRKHHALCETRDDPHSPLVYGIREVLLRGAELYRKAVTEETMDRYGKGCPDDWIERNIYLRCPFCGISLLMVLDLVLFGVSGLIVWAVQMLVIPVLAAGVINGLGHHLGYRNYESLDVSRNILPWGILIGGEELHNNHHTYPHSAKFSSKWWEFDIGWLYIRLLSACGLAKVRNAGQTLAIQDPLRKVVDMNTVMGAINDRFRIMANYTNEVVAPLVRNERAAASKANRRILRRAERLLCCDTSWFSDSKEREHDGRIEQIFKVSAKLEEVHTLYRELQDVWQQRVKSKGEILAAFTGWLKKAEDSSIDAVREFAESLKTYTLPARQALSSG